MESRRGPHGSITFSDQTEILRLVPAGATHKAAAASVVFDEERGATIGQDPRGEAQAGTVSTPTAIASRSRRDLAMPARWQQFTADRRGARPSAIHGIAGRGSKRRACTLP